MNNLHFWYSEIQAKALMAGSTGDPVLDANLIAAGDPPEKLTTLNTAMISVDGKSTEVTYTEAADEMIEHSALFPDSVYLGVGQIWTIDGSRENVAELESALEEEGEQQ